MKSRESPLKFHGHAHFTENLTREMGKPLAEAKIEMQTAIDLLRWYGEEGKRVYGRIIPSRIPNMEHEARKVPVGPVLAFVAWNLGLLYWCGAGGGRAHRNKCDPASADTEHAISRFYPF